MAKIALNKTRPAAKPYLIVEADGWTWRVLRAYTNDPEARFARWFCEVTSPWATDLGDTYVTDVQGRVVYRDPEVLDENLPSRMRQAVRA